MKIYSILNRSSIINGKGWFYLRQGLERLTTLKYLWLDFYSLMRSDDEALEEIACGLTKLTALEFLFLGFYNNAAVRNQGVICLGEGFKDLVSLKNLKINLGYSGGRIKEYGFFSLSISFQNLSNLENLLLDVSKYSLQKFQ